MKYVDEFRDPEVARGYIDAIAALTSRPWRIMEVCGGQTHTIVRYGIDELLPDDITIIHGPGCPVCVTPLELIDRAIAIAELPGVLFCSFGDMLRVPGSHTDLFAAKSRGADVRIVYSPLDALQLAKAHPDREVVFFAVGFETTAPANAMAVHLAAREGVNNFSMLVSHVLVPPALEAILGAPNQRVDAVLAAGHVCTIMGLSEYYPIVARHHVPLVVTGFEPGDILQGVLMCIRQLEGGRALVENQYARSVRSDGNEHAVRMIRTIFEVAPRKWRGLGTLVDSGLVLNEAHACFDAEQRFDVGRIETEECSDCISGLILQGLKKPSDCPAFGGACTPTRPLGATMVSSEGACAAYFRYRGDSP